MGLGCAFIFVVMNTIRLTAFILYYISAFDNATSLLNGSDSIFDRSDYELNRKCTNKDDDFMARSDKNFSFGSFIISFILNVAIFSINSVGYYKWYYFTDEFSKYFGNSFIFEFFSIIFWVPGNFSARINYSESCTIVEGIMVHFFNIHGFRYVIASFSITLISILIMIFIGILELTFMAAFTAVLLLYSILYYFLSLIIIIWCTWAFQIPWIVIFILESIFGFAIICGWTLGGEVKTQAPNLYLLIVVFY